MLPSRRLPPPPPASELEDETLQWTRALHGNRKSRPAKAAKKKTARSTGRVIFLGVDGVLHPTKGETFFEPECMRSLRSIVEQTSAAVVLTSFWQANPASRRKVNAALRRWGLPPMLACTVNGPPGEGSEARVKEIADWVRRRGKEACATSWVVLDDMDLSQPLDGMPQAIRDVGLQRHFVRTDAAVGINSQTVSEAVKILGRNVGGVPLQPPQENCEEPEPRPQTNIRPASMGVANHGTRLQHMYQREWTPDPGQKAWRTHARYGRSDSLPMPNIKPPKTLRTQPTLLS